jgi:tRNA-2-methylthio-N6-dimethylallyladenosine synthase
MNEQQRKESTQVTPTDKKSEKDYSQYFQAVYMPPSLKEAKKRGKEEVKYDGFSIPEEFRGMGHGKKFYIRTYGCQMNEHDTEVMAGIFMALGYEPTDGVEDANVILLNTCAIRENA